MRNENNAVIMNKVGIYSTGFFSLSLQTMILLVIPLYALSLNASPFTIGVASSAFSILPLFFSIMSGALIDRIGSKKVITICAAITMILSILHPLIPNMGLIIIFQLIIGQVLIMIWIASQTLIAKINNKHENRKGVAIYSFMVSLGTFTGPMLTGFFWEKAGPWGGFLTIFFWTLCLYFSTLLIDKSSLDRNGENEYSMPKKVDSRGVFRKSMLLLSIPVVLMVMFGTFLRLTSFTMRGSFYLIYLEQISLSVLSISFLYSLFSLIASISPFFTGLLIKLIEEKKLLFVSAFLSIMPLTITPLFSNFWSFFALAVTSGFFMGVSLPILISILSKAVDPELQGTAIGLREMSNRFAATIIPFMFGLFVQQFGLEVSFFAVGGLILLLIVFISPLLLLSDQKYLKQSETEIHAKGKSL